MSASATTRGRTLDRKDSVTRSGRSMCAQMEQGGHHPSPLTRVGGGSR